MKERGRFDALAEELASDEPKPEPPRKTLTAEAQARRDATVKSYSKFPAPTFQKLDGIREQPRAYISVMGRPYTVIEWRVSSRSSNDSEFGGTADQFRTSFEVKLKLPGAVPAADLLQDQSVILMLKNPDREMDYVRLEIIDVVVRMSETDRYTEVNAYGTAVT